MLFASSVFDFFKFKLDYFKVVTVIKIENIVVHLISFQIQDKLTSISKTATYCS